MTTSKIEHPRVVSRAEWLVARKELLTKEKQFTRQRDALSAERRELPWVRDDYCVDPMQTYRPPQGSDSCCGAGEDHS